MKVGFMFRRAVVLILVIVIAAVIAGCDGNPVREQVESSVAKAMPDVIGPAKSYQVRAYGPTLRLMKGKLDGLDITGTDVKLPSGITVSKLDVKIRDMVVDTDTKEIKRADSTEYSAVLTQAELFKHLKKRYPDVPGLGLQLKKGVMNISAKPGVSIAKVGVQADASLKVRDEHILALDLKKLKVAGIGAPQMAVNYLQSKIDTVFDTNDLGFEAKIKSAVITPGALTLNGSMDLMKAMEKKKALKK